MVHVLLANGFEELEALSVVDFLRRAEIGVQTVSTMSGREVTGAHGIPVWADTLIEDAIEAGENSLLQSDLIVLPGGLPGATNLRENKLVEQAVLAQAGNGRPLAAICAAPYVLGELNLLVGKRATCYPGFDKYLTGATYTGNMVEKDGNIITGKGPAAAFLFASEIVGLLAGEDVRRQVEAGMLID